MPIRDGTRSGNTSARPAIVVNGIIRRATLTETDQHAGRQQRQQHPLDDHRGIPDGVGNNRLAANVRKIDNATGNAATRAAQQDRQTAVL